MSAKQLVGCARVNPLLQEIVKTSSGGMAAVSAGFVAFFITSQRADTGMALLALSLLALSIPLLVGARIFFNIIDNYEYISSRADRLLESLFACGFFTAFLGYEVLLAMVSNLAFWAFSAGVLTAVFAIWLLSKEVDQPQMRRAQIP